MNEIKGESNEPRDFSFELPEFDMPNPECVEFEHSETQEFTPSQIEGLEELSEDAISEVHQKYGSGFPDYIKACDDKGMFYHNAHHTRKVGQTAGELALAAGLSNDEAKLCKTAGYAHDIFQGPGHEGKSAGWLVKKMRTSELYDNDSIELASLAIKGTEVIFDDGKVIGQKATTQDYPSKSAEIAGLSVASGDLGELFTPQGPMLSHDLYREIKGTTEIDDSFADFVQNQVAFLSNYKYPLPEAEKLLTARRGEVIDYNLQVLEQLERGDIESWEQLRSQDMNFLLKHL